MRIHHVGLQNYKNLKDFTIQFDEDEPISAIIGRNGSAKSNLIEAITELFAYLMIGQKTDAPTFDCHIRYRIRDTNVSLDYVPSHRNPIAINSIPVSLDRLRDPENSFLPQRLVLYYSGESDRYDRLVNQWDRIAWEQSVKGGPNIELRKVIKALPIHAKYAAISYFANPDPKIEKFLEEAFDIVGFDSALFVVNKPSWAKKSDTVKDFWGARGESKDVLNRLIENSFAPFSESVRTPIAFNKNVTRELLYCFIPDQDSLHLTVGDQSVTDFFQSLDTLRLSDLLDDLRIRVRIKKADQSIYTRDLSEGELQLLSVVGLMRFTRQEESLFLLDEPDTHLNPYWSLRYLQYLAEVGEVQKNSHTIIATHDPILVSGLTKEQIRVLYKLNSGSIGWIEPTEDPKGKGVAYALTSELFGLESQLDLSTTKLLDQRRAIAAKENLTQADIRHLDNFNKQLSSLGFIDTNIDPIRNELENALYRAFKEEELDHGNLTPDQVLRRRELARELLKSRNAQ